MFNNLTIKMKNIMIIGGSSLVALIIMAVGWYSIENLNESSNKIENIQESIIHNERIVAIHEKFAGALARSYSKNEAFNGATDHTLCALGRWYYSAKNSGELNNIPDETQKKFEDMEISHTNLHAIAKDYKLNFNHLDRGLKTIINQKEIDHLNWAKALSNSIVSKKVARVQTDPSKCTFGKWVVDFKTNDEIINNMLNDVLVPHNKLHATASRIIKLQKQKKHTKAMKVYQKETLPLLTDIQSIFYEIKQHINDVNEANREISDNIVYTVPEDLRVVIDALNSYNNHLKAQSSSLINNNQSLKSTVETIMIIMLLILIIGIAVGLVLTRSVQQGIDSINKVTANMAINNDTSMRIDINTDDEIGQIAKNFNSYLDQINNDMQQDQKVVEEIAIIVEKVKNGFYNYSVQQNGKSVMINNLKNNFNEMLEATDLNLSEIRDAVVSYANYDFTAEVNLQNVSGSIGSLTNSSKALGINVSELVAIINKAGDELNRKTAELAASSEELSAASVEQASSLEETAASIEEITSNINATAEKAHIMSEITDETKGTVNQGVKLASDSSESMQDIVNATTEIAEAITAIDQIAFQTNILSLNAAVEAATAGEAGKGFAVVAGEVRNLAARSAETAAQIKTIVNQAQSKAQEGQQVTDDMLNGYTLLNDKMEETFNIVQDVEKASKEQLQGINQINDAVAQLDQMTQQNAATANLISEFSQEISDMASNLNDVASKVKYNQSVTSHVCNINMSFETAKLKLDHVKFKDNNFKKIGQGNQWRVVNEHECNLGKWIDAHQNDEFAKTDEWQELLKVHAHVHSGVQDYINVDANNAYDTKLYQIAHEVEDDTSKVFELIDKIKEHDCRNTKKNQPTAKQDNSKKVTKPSSPANLTNNETDEWDSF